MTREDWGPSRWELIVAQRPEHSQWYIERFRAMEREGADIVGEARLADAMVERGSRVLDAGCGPGRLAGELFRRGHDVVGVDIDPDLVEAAQADHPGPVYAVADLSELDLPALGIADPFDLVVVAGNVLTFLAPGSETEVLRRLGAHLAPGGRIVAGFGLGRGYELASFEADVVAAGLRESLRLATWDLRPWTPESDFVVSVLELG
ncbi:class I SAM-dependent methyltransferase [Salana multivorans]